MPVRQTPLDDIHVHSARKMVKGDGDFMFPLSNTSPVEEHLDVRRKVGMQDLSSRGEVAVTGSGAERLIRLPQANQAIPTAKPTARARR